MATWLPLLGGLVLLSLGGEWLVRGAVGAARALGVSPLLVGLTIVGFGTSTPELVTSLFAAFEDAPGIAVGNIVGSNTANILFILGISALISPLAIQPQAFRRDGLALAVSAIACLVAVLLGFLDRWVGVLLVAMLVGYITWAYRNEKRTHDAEAVMHEHLVEDVAGPRRTALAVGLALLGIAATVLGARLLVDGAITLVRGLGVSEAVIGLTIVAVGTSLPELVTCVIAALRRHSDVALGNIIGSNIYNVLGILGLTAAVHPIAVPPEIAEFDIWIMMLATGLLMVFLRTGWLLKRWEGLVFLLGYVAYVAHLAVSA